MSAYLSRETTWLSIWLTESIRITVAGQRRTLIQKMTTGLPQK